MDGWMESVPEPVPLLDRVTLSLSLSIYPEQTVKQDLLI